MRIAIIGAGFGGIGAAIRLKQAGFDDIVILERAADVGGVWRDNTYPGCACDVESHLYSFSFAPNPTWTRAYSPQREILAYLQRVTDEHDVRRHVRFGHAVKHAAWSSHDRRWQIETSHGPIVADVLIGAQGALCEPSLPDLEGLASFAGKTMHSARWDNGYDVAGKRVAIIGTGASAIQIVPAIQPAVASLTIFQRTPPWILPRDSGPIPPTLQKLYAAVPFAQRIRRASIAVRRELYLAMFVNERANKIVRGHAKRYLRSVVKDPELRKRLTPRYAIGCKRILLSNDYLPALVQPNVTVASDAVRVTERSVIDRDGRAHDVDAIVLATGFHVTDMPFARFITGADGRTLAETWNGSMRAHVGTTVHGFPNLFLILGPNTGLGHTSVLTMMEAQFDHVVGATTYMRDHAIRALEPTLEAQAKFVSEVEAKMPRTVWVTGGCSSWYLDANGKNTSLWPGSTMSFRRRVAPFHARDYAPVDSAIAPAPDVAIERAAREMGAA